VKLSVILSQKQNTNRKDCHVECLPSMCEALGSITAERGREKEKEEGHDLPP
jgi:hypothetical protein